MRLSVMMLTTALATAPVLSAGASAPGSVRCCVKLGIDGVVDPPRCLKVNLNITPRRLARHPKRACRLVGGTPAASAACTCA